MANYLESTMVARECEDDLSPLESKIKASSKFFGPSCKPGPWTIDPVQDAVLSMFLALFLVERYLLMLFFYS